MRTPTISMLALLTAALAAPTWAGEAVPEDVSAGTMNSNPSLPPEQSGIAVATSADESADADAPDEAEAASATEEPADGSALADSPSDSALISSSTQIQPNGTPPEEQKPAVPPRE